MNKVFAVVVHKENNLYVAECPSISCTIVTDTPDRDDAIIGFIL